MRRIENVWRTLNLTSVLLLPLAAVYCLIALTKRLLYRYGLLAVTRLDAPVIVVGNITVGGGGKSPFVSWLTGWLQEQGLRPGIVARGFGGRAQIWPQAVSAQSDPRLVGDEPVMLARQTGCPVVVAPDRVLAVRTLLANGRCNIVISDDGLQHYRMGRDLEIAVVDGVRREGNGLCLPAGPLREPRSRLRSVDLVLVRGQRRAAETGFDVVPAQLVNLRNPALTKPLGAFAGRRVQAVAGIGYPQRFFDALRNAGMEVVEHIYPDHYEYGASDLDLDSQETVVMTEKDAVKCVAFAHSDWWYVEVDVVPDPVIVQRLEQFLRGQSFGQETA